MAFDGARHALLITDHCMPGMMGPELIRALRQRCPLLPVIALTGAGEKAERELLAAGADERSSKSPSISARSRRRWRGH